MLSWIHPILRRFGIMRPWDEGCVASLFVAASPEFTADMSGLFFDEKANVSKPNASASEVAQREKLEKWTGEKMKAGGWL